MLCFSGQLISKPCELEHRFSHALALCPLKPEPRFGMIAAMVQVG